MQSKTDRSSKLWGAGLCSSLLLLATVMANAQTTSTIKCVQVAAATRWSPTSRVVVSYPLAQTAGNLNIIVVGWNDTSAKRALGCRQPGKYLRLGGRTDQGDCPDPVDLLRHQYSRGKQYRDRDLQSARQLR